VCPTYAPKSVDTTATAVTGASVAVGIDEGEPQGVAASGDYVLYGSAQAFNVEADPIAHGEGHLEIGASQGGLAFGHRSIQADAMYVYWAVNGTVQRAPFTGAAHAQKTAGAGLGNITASAIDATSVYFASDEGCALARLAVGNRDRAARQGRRPAGSCSLTNTHTGMSDKTPAQIASPTLSK
jgi:hypothetical protein